MPEMKTLTVPAREVRVGDLVSGDDTPIVAVEAKTKYAYLTRIDESGDFFTEERRLDHEVEVVREFPTEAEWAAQEREFLIGMAERDRSQALSDLEDALTQIAREGVRVSAGHLAALVRAQAEVRLWNRIEVIRQRRGGDLLSAVEVVVRESVRELLRADAGCSTNVMDSACDRLAADVKSRFVGRHGVRIGLSLWEK